MASNRSRRQGSDPTFADLVRTDLKTKEYRPVYLLVGEDTYRIESVVAWIRDEMLGPEGTAFNYHLFQGEQAGLESVLQQAYSFPMLGARQLLWLRDADKCLADPTTEKALLSYLQQPVDASILVLSAIKLDGRKRWVKYCRTAGYLFSFAPPEGRDLVQWVRVAASRKGVRLVGVLPEMLIDLVGDDLHALAAEIDKLALLSSEGEQELDAEQMEDLIMQQRLGDRFELTNALRPGDAGPALHVWHQQSAWGRGAMELGPLLVSRMRKIALVAALAAEGHDISEISALAQLHPYACQQLSRSGRQLGQEGIRRALAACHDFDASLKRSAIRPELAMERLLLDICADKFS